MLALSVWPGFDSRARCHMWVERLVIAWRGFSSDTQVFFPPKKWTYLNSYSIWNPGATGLSLAGLLSVYPCAIFSYLYLFYYLREPTSRLGGKYIRKAVVDIPHLTVTKSWIFFSKISPRIFFTREKSNCQSFSE